MIHSAAEFVILRTSDNPAEYHRAANEEAPLEVWLEVIRDFPEMRFWVAQNKTVPIEALRVLYCDESERVRGMVAVKRKLPVELQWALVSDESASVRHSLCGNARLDQAVLRALCEDSEPFVRNAAQRKLSCDALNVLVPSKHSSNGIADGSPLLPLS